MRFKYKIYIVTDSHGNKDVVVCDEPSNCVHVSGMKDELGEGLYFESEAYHLQTWCDEHKMDLLIINRVIEV